MIALPKRSRPNINADINIVPYIDVMLVLLVIFMMTSPIIEQGIEIDLPGAPAEVVDYQDQQPTIVSVKRGDDGKVKYYLNGLLDDDDDFVARDLSWLVSTIEGRKDTQLLAGGPDLQVFIRGDKEVEYQEVIKVVAAIKKLNKIDKLGFMTENPNK